MSSCKNSALFSSMRISLIFSFKLPIVMCTDPLCVLFKDDLYASFERRNVFFAKGRMCF